MKPSLAGKVKTACEAVFAAGGLEALPRFFASDYVVHLTGAAPATGHQAVRQFLALLRRAFPELQVDVEVLAEAGDRIAWQRTLRGIQRGPFHGFPASDRDVVWREMVVSRFQDGVIAEEWLVSDLAERLLNSRKKTASAASAKPPRGSRAKR